MARMLHDPCQELLAQKSTLDKVMKRLKTYMQDLVPSNQIFALQVMWMLFLLVMKKVGQ